MSGSGKQVRMPEPWLWFETILYSSSYQAEMHRHSAWQLTASVFGEFRFRTGQGTVLLHPGEWVLMAPGVLHDVGSDSSRSRALQLFFRRFPPDLLPEFAMRFNLLRGVVRTGRMELAELKRILRDFLTRTGEDQPFGKSWRISLGQEFTVRALGALPKEVQTGPRVSPAVLRVLEYMEEHFAEPLGVADFAQVAGLSESRFAANFKAETGEAPMHCLNVIRLGRAQGLLLNGSSVEEASRASGFSSVQYFCRVFRRSIGMTPGEFRKTPFSHRRQG